MMCARRFEQAVTRRGPRHGTAAILAAGLAAAPVVAARAEPAQELVQAAAEALAPLVTADGLAETCDRREPSGTAARRSALESWRSALPLAAFDEALRRAIPEPALRSLRSSIDRSASRQIETAVRGQPAICREFASVLASPSMRIAGKMETLRRLAAAQDGQAGGDPVASPALPPAKVTLHTLAQLSALVSGAMDAAGPKPQERDRKLADARSEAGKAALKRLGRVAAKGRVVKDDRLREWRGERQSSFEIRCRSFADRPDGERMKAALGRDLVVVGEVRYVSETRSKPGGLIVLRDCRVAPPDTQGFEPSSAPDEAGLTMRPLEATEAFAGPDKGIDPGDVDAVLYEADFSSRMDGFGNGYVARREDIYVLLDDGTAYLHQWPFPFTDLDVAQSKRREPTRWFTWKSGWLSPAVTLTSSTGKTRTIETPKRLQPLKAGARFTHAYYYLTVAMGGRRSDRNVAFHQDGTLTATRSSFVAASTGHGGGDVGVSGPGFAYSGGGAGQGFLITPGRRGETKGRYEITPWALTITAEDGATERRFLARPEDETGSPPDRVILDGEAYWTRKPK